MARNVFFSFDYDDVRGVNVVRKSNVVRPRDGDLTFRDFSLYEKVKPTDAVIRKAIDDGLQNTSVTVVLVGGATWASYWARYEIVKSVERGNGFLVIDIDGVGPGITPTAGPNPLDYIALYPWDTRAGFDVGEWRDGKWHAPPLLSSFPSNYPGNLMPSGPVKLSQIFTHRDHWRAAQMYFSTMVDIAAEKAGH